MTSSFKILTSNARAANGREDWKLDDGTTLKEIQTKNTTADKVNHEI